MESYFLIFMDPKGVCSYLHTPPEKANYNPTFIV